MADAQRHHDEKNMALVGGNLFHFDFNEIIFLLLGCTTLYRHRKASSRDTSLLTRHGNELQRFASDEAIFFVNCANFNTFILKIKCTPHITFRQAASRQAAPARL